MKLTKSQSRVVETLFSEYIKQEKKIIDFSAPAGSGKTFMASYFISKVFANNTNQKTMVIVATISNAQLPKAFAEKINQYKQYLTFQNFEVEFRQSPSNNKKQKQEHIKGFYLENNKVIVFGTSSFGKKKLFSEQGVLENFIAEAKSRQWKIIYIRDEAHRGGTSTRETAEKNYYKFDDQMIKLAQFTIQMTATPKGKYNLIALNKEELEEDGVCLLKNQLKYNFFTQNTKTAKELIDQALKKFKQVQKEYQKLKEFIRPALLIQVDSRSKNITEKEYQQTLVMIKQQLKNSNFTYLQYFSNDIEGNAKEEQTLKAAAKKDSNYDAIIFKIGPATGWDIPRACMLLQIREVSSEILNIQTLGRIKRNPLTSLEKSNITDKYYLYSNYQEGRRNLASYKLKKSFHNLKLYQGKVILEEQEKKLLEENYMSEIKKKFSSSAIADHIKTNKKASKLEIEYFQYFSPEGTKNAYSHYVYSMFRLKIWNTQMKLQYQKYFTTKLNDFVVQYAKKTNVAQEIVIYTIIKEYINDLKNIYLKSYQKQQKKAQYKICANKNLLTSYQIWITKDQLNLEISDFDAYGYQLINRINNKVSFSLKDKQNQVSSSHSGKEKNQQYLDSKPERNFMEKIVEEMEEAEEYQKQVLFFAKMPTLGSQIYFEYLKSTNDEKHKAYIDFALVEKDKKKILMIEVKSENDYDEEKTKDLLIAFRKYQEQNSALPIELMICYAGSKGKKPEIKFLDENGTIRGKSIRKTLKTFFC